MADNLNEQQTIFVNTFINESINNGLEHYAAARLAKEAAGYSDNYNVYLILSSDAVQKAIIKACQSHLTLALPKAVSKTTNLLDNPTQDGARRLQETANTIMDRVGLIKVDKQELEIKAPDGVILLPPKTITNKE